MTANQLDRLLADVRGGHAGEVEHLGPRSVYELAFHPDRVTGLDQTHWKECPYCQAQVVRARRHEDTIHAPLPAEVDEPPGADLGVLHLVIGPGATLTSRAADKGSINI